MCFQNVINLVEHIRIWYCLLREQGTKHQTTEFFSLLHKIEVNVVVLKGRDTSHCLVSFFFQLMYLFSSLHKFVVLFTSESFDVLFVLMV
jgi:hypothetical protein